MPATSDWTSSENGAIVDAYLLILDRELRGEAYLKAHLNRRLQEQIGRSHSSSRSSTSVSADRASLKWPAPSLTPASWTRPRWRPCPAYQSVLAELSSGVAMEELAQLRSVTTGR